MNLNNEYYYQDFERQFISNMGKYIGIKNQIQAIGLDLCSSNGKIGVIQEYINKALKGFEHGYVYRDISNNQNDIVGFVLWRYMKFKSKSEMYITLICGKGLGTLIFNDIENYAINNNINTITLTPINDKVKQHYINEYGFKSRGYNKQLGNVYYKNINTVKNVIKKTKETIKHHMKNRKTTLKTKKNKENNNINNFILLAQSKSKSIMTLPKLISSNKHKTFKNMEELKESNYFNTINAVNEFK
jgi:hypothetical protein